jgi:hypothetical protein
MANQYPFILSLSKDRFLNGLSLSKSRRSRA